MRCFHRNQQYSTSAVTDGSAAIVERYAYSAYGTPTITDASGTTRTTTAIGNRYSYTGREWDETLALYHYRARMYDSVAGRFISRDPIGFEGSEWNFYELHRSSPVLGTDPYGHQWWKNGGGGRTLKLCLRWQYWDYQYFDCIAEPARSKYITEDYIRLRDSAIAAYRESMETLKQNIAHCCKKYNLNCDLKLEYDFKLKPIRLRPFRDPRDGASQVNCAGGLSVLIITNHRDVPNREHNAGESSGPGIPYIWITNTNRLTLSHECGHCGGYRPPSGKSLPMDPWHNSDPDNLMYPVVGGAGIDQNWCQALSSLEAKL